MNFLKKVGRRVADFFEISIPGTLFIVMFLIFVFNVVMRYIFRNSQHWAQEFISNAFMIIGLLSACVAHKYEDLVVFDLFYSALGGKGKNILRLISNALVVIGISIAIPFAVRYVWNLPAVTPEMKIPQNIIFASIPILFISAVIRSGYRFVMDIISLKDKTYLQRYNDDDTQEMLI